MKYNVLALTLVLVILVPGAYAYAQSEPAKVTVTSSLENISAKVGQERSITWETENFPRGAFVNVNLIRKVSDSPAQYELVREIAKYSVNDGEEVWKVSKTDKGDNLYVEVTCAGSARFKSGCTAEKNTGEFAVKGSFSNNLANAFLSIFGLER